VTEQETPNVIPFTDKNPCGLMSGHNHRDTRDGWIVCETRQIKWPSFNLRADYNTCYNRDHEHTTYFGYGYCHQENVYWAISEQAKAESEARSTARVTGSVGATVIRERRDAEGNLVQDAIAVYKTLKQAQKEFSE
jgi:hypothetical protein